MFVGVHKKPPRLSAATAAIPPRSSQNFKMAAAPDSDHTDKTEELGWGGGGGGG